MALFAALLCLGAAGASAYESSQSLDSSQFEAESFTASSSDPRAGAATDFRNRIDMKTGIVNELRVPYGRTKRVEVRLPAGLVGNPNAFPTCPVGTFLKVIPSEGCPAETQVGTATFETWGVAGELKGPVFNLTPGEDQPALFGIKPSPVLYAYLTIKVSADGELTAVADENPIVAPMYFADVTMWGVPADHPGVPGPRVPFMTNPTNCSDPFVPALRVEAYEGEEDTATVSEAPRSECANLPFAPSLKVEPTSREAGAPTGLDVRIEVPQTADPDGIASAHVKDVTMALPEGMTVSASSASGLGSCSPQEFGYHQETPVSCPLSSKIGSVEVETPLLKEPMVGPVYVAKQNDNPFDSLLALYMVPSGQGATIKLAGKVDLDPRTGRLTTTFLNNPQQPFSRLRVSLKDGPRAPLALPRACGSYAATAQLASWARPGEAVPLSSSFPVDQGCGREGQFTPGFAAGTTEPRAGAFSPFTLRVTRPDAQENVERIEATLPEGLLAKLAGVPVCPEVTAASAACPEASRVGSTTVGVGPGSMPTFAPEPGKAPTALYLGGPYAGAPYSLIAKVPAQAGPFDLGTVVLRNALRVDPRTTQVTAVSDPLPQFLQGIPIAYRDVRVEVDRPGFTLNPTSCAPMSVDGRIGSSGGHSARVSDRFAASGCAALGFKPRLALRLRGGTRRSDHPALTATLTARKGDANIGHVSVALPHSEFLAQDHIRTVCTRVQFAADACPPGSVYGRARAITPLLDQPLEGPVYLRSSDNPLPDLVAHLGGQIEVDLVGRIDSVRGGLRTTFDLVPDAPVSKFVLSMQGGRKGLLENSRDLCRRSQRATVRMEAQNGSLRELGPELKSSGCKKRGKTRR